MRAGLRCESGLVWMWLRLMLMQSHCLLSYFHCVCFLGGSWLPPSAYFLINQELALIVPGMNGDAYILFQEPGTMFEKTQNTLSSKGSRDLRYVYQSLLLSSWSKSPSCGNMQALHHRQSCCLPQTSSINLVYVVHIFSVLRTAHHVFSEWLLPSTKEHTFLPF
jgi:hypothetical protein